MRRFILIVLLILTASIASTAKNKTAVSYDGTGYIVLRSALNHYDSEATLSTSSGTAFAGCNYSGTSVNCSDQMVSVGWTVSIQGGTGSYRAFEGLTTINGKHSVFMKECVEEAYSNYPFACDPIGVLTGHLHGNGDTLKFQYRMITVTKDEQYHFGESNIGKKFFCVPFDVTDKKGKVKQGEACYKVDAAP